MLNLFKKRDSEKPVSEIAKFIFYSSVQCSELVKKYLLEKYKSEENNEYTIAYSRIVLETTFFLMHYIQRLSFVLLSQSDREHFSELLFLYVKNPTINALYDGYTEDVKDKVRNSFALWANKSEMGYSQCKDILPDEDNGLDKLISRTQRTRIGLINEFIDKLYSYICEPVEICTKPCANPEIERQRQGCLEKCFAPPCLNPIFILEVTNFILDIFKTNKIENLIKEYKKTIN